MSATEILYLLLLAVANSFVIIGWNRATNFELKSNEIVKFKNNFSIEIDESTKMLFWRFRYWTIFHLGEFWSKPMFTCCTCMASVHSTYFYWSIMPFTLHSLIVYPLYIVGLAGVVTLINNHA